MIVISLALFACDLELFALNVDRAEQEATQTAIAATAQASSPSQTELPPATLVLPENEPAAEEFPQHEHPEIFLNFTADNMMDLPAYRANLSEPIIVDNEGAFLQPAYMEAYREDDVLKLGGIQPGTVRQVTNFDGTYDPATGELKGTLVHEITVSLEATENYASETYYIMTCTLTAQRLANSNNIEGVCDGQSTETYTVPENTSSNHKWTKSVHYEVTGTISDTTID